ncbi:tRNA 2-selenouridine(34) synthase MnmH [Nitrosomonas sp. Is37]|uniref:tRNA 2-selenouridine(34) synthase MnmH n=1 Tax=Nitrosomonas sp. Is37 TaxID=3080535 RepID=UPI00294B60F7|nr:tRNA 2-selenouridine(34) synthase MnmH [Nitrosomonas sp. Is37]MDV6345609.1 tRNA 2-selenouridine(34) synthase MnmH [Nitrosomonas sp. Is37]
MSNQNIRIDELKELLVTETPLIDVRAPVEFLQGSLPGAINIPILNNEERALVGTTYKNQGQEAAVRLGYQIISGPVKQSRLDQWLKFVRGNPRTVLYCFRGGKRSQITQQWLKEAGIERPLIVGGYKMVRQFLMDAIDQFSEDKKLLVITGPTGSGKTKLIHAVRDIYPALDLETIAQHRGSAFGGLPIPQPTQIDFENRLAVSLLKLENRIQSDGPLMVEDESRFIGKVYLPASFFTRIRSSEVIWLDEPFEARVENIFEDYVLNTAIGHAQQRRQGQKWQPQRLMELQGQTAQQQFVEIEGAQEVLHNQAFQLFEKYKNSLYMISKKLGGKRFQEVLDDLENAQLDFLNMNEIRSNKVWIEKLVKYYYDPLYLSSLERRQVIPCFKGSKKDVIDYLQYHKQGC